MSKRVVLARILIFGLLVFLAAWSLPALAGEDEGGAACTTAMDAAAAAQTPSGGTVAASLHQTPLYFIENRGQISGPVAYYVQGKDKTLYFTSGGVTLVLHGLASSVIASETKQSPATESWELPRLRLALTQDVPHAQPVDSVAQRWVVRLEFVGANADVQPEGADETGAMINYFKGQPDEWVTGLRTYSKVVYHDLWPGIDLEYSGTVDRLKYQFLVHPGTDPNRIRLAYRGASEVAINDRGQLEVTTPAGGFHDDKPLAYQEGEGGQRVEVEVSYQLEPASHELEVYGFSLGDYDHTRPLVLDPAVLVYCGFLGGSGLDDGAAIAVDSEGNAYLTGSCESTEASFPVAVGPDLTYNGGWRDAFVAKVISDATALAYCGYIGGIGDDHGCDIAVDADGNAYVTGMAQTTQDTFPVTVGPDLTYNGGYWDSFVAKVTSDGTALAYCGYIGGSQSEAATGITVDGSGNAYVVGVTLSDENSFPVAVGPDLHYAGGNDAFVAKVTPDGAALAYCGYIGGSETDQGYGIAVDGDGNAYVTGYTESGEDAGFPVNVGPDRTFNGQLDAFVAKVRADALGFVYSGFVGGGKTDWARGIAVDDYGRAYVVGHTSSAEGDAFPVMVGPDLTFNGDSDAFVARVSALGATLEYCGYIGGTSGDFGRGIAVDHFGAAYVTGDTDSSKMGGFPVVPDDLNERYSGDTDAFVARVTTDGSTLSNCGYLGGSASDFGLGIAVDAFGNAYVSGSTHSDETSFPVRRGPDLHYGGHGDAFVAKVAIPEAPGMPGNPSPPEGNTGVGLNADLDWSQLDSRWSWINEEPSQWSLSQRPSFLRIVAHNGAVGQQNLLVQSAPSGDFTVTTRVLFEATSNYQSAGLTVYHEGDNYMMLGLAYCQATLPGCVGHGVYFDHMEDGSFVGGNFALPLPALKRYKGYLRVSHHSGAYSGYYSADGVAWTLLGTHTRVSSVDLTQVGVTAARDLASSGTPADFDFFQLESAAGAWSDNFSGASSYDVYFGTDSPPPFYGSTTSSDYALPRLAELTHYFWRIVANNEWGQTFGEEWDFTTAKNSPPSCGAVDPSSGSGPVSVTTYFTATWSDPDGWQDLKQCYFHIGASQVLAGNVTLMYNAAKEKLWLLDDLGMNWTGGFAPGSTNTLENSQARVYCNVTTVSGVADTLFVSWAIEFKPGFEGTKKLGLKAKDMQGAKAKGKWKGSWTIE